MQTRASIVARLVGIADQLEQLPCGTPSYGHYVDRLVILNAERRRLRLALVLAGYPSEAALSAE
jgi:hypothetical protein